MKKGIGKRGKDKGPRIYGGGRPPVAPEDKSLPCSTTLYATEKRDVIRIFGKLNRAIRWALANYPAHLDN